MATARTPQDRKAPASRSVQRRSSPEELGPDGATLKLRAATRAASTRRSPSTRRSSVSSAELAQEAAPAVARPAGMPDLRPLFALHRRDRAKYLRAMDKMTSNVRANKQLRDIDLSDGEEAVQQQIISSPSVLTVTADLAEMAADIEDALVLVAVEPSEFEAWAHKATDEALLQAFTWYQEQAAPGEA